MNSDDRVTLAYSTFRGGCREDNAPPRWGELEPWMRDAMRVAYLQGTLDAPESLTGRSTMTEMLKMVGDAIAKALDSRAYGLYDYSNYPGDKPPHCVRDERSNEVIFRSSSREKAEERWIELNRAFVARAAIETMREPTAEMLDAASGPAVHAAIEWRAMIDAALTNGNKNV